MKKCRKKIEPTHGTVLYFIFFRAKYPKSIWQRYDNEYERFKTNKRVNNDQTQHKRLLQEDSKNIR